MCWNQYLVAWLVVFLGTVEPLSLRADIELVATFVFAGTDVDDSELLEQLPTGEPHNRLGGFSAIEYLGANRYLVLSDRGPGDGAARFSCRWHEMELQFSAPTKTPSAARLVRTTCLRDQQHRVFTGFSAAIDGRLPSDGLRCDPEGLRVLDKKVFVSEEYGPLLLAFAFDGRQIGQIPLPGRFSILYASTSLTEENARNNIGRQSNRGPEGLAITPDGRTIVAAMQGPLLQDAERLPDGKLRGRFARLVAIDLANHATRVIVYPLEDSTTGISEILAINAHEFLVLERDSTAGVQAKFKRITRVDLSFATNVHGIDSLPPDALPAEIQPVRKTTLLDFLNPTFGLTGERFPEKFEGLTFGPRLDDGRLSLVVTVDNDFEPDEPSLILVFAISPAELPAFAWQR